MKKLKIEIIAPIVERIPPKKYGGTERVIHALTDELVRRGQRRSSRKKEHTLILNYFE